MYAPLVIPDIWTELQCQRWIEQSNARGWSAADVETASGLSRQTRIRQNSKREDVDQDMANALVTAWSDAARKVDQHMVFSALFPRWRTYRYGVGDLFVRHRDGRKTMGSQTSNWTVLLYLNEDFQGGQTVFYPETTELAVEPLIITPTTGALIIFEHNVWHASLPVHSGIKYVLRTDAFGAYV